jgi:hypothetical protein
MRLRPRTAGASTTPRSVDVWTESVESIKSLTSCTWFFEYALRIGDRLASSSSSSW